MLFAPVLLVLATAVPAAPDADFDLPVPPVPMDEAPRPQPPPERPATPALAAPVAPSIAPSQSEAPPAQAPARYLVPSTGFIDGGFGGSFVRLTGLDGQVGVLSGATVDVTRGRFSAGLSFTRGGTDTVRLTTAGLRAGARLATWGLVDVGAGMTLGVGAASRGTQDTTERAAVVTWEPEVSARVPLLPWVRAQASLGYRLANVGDWAGPNGDALAGFGAGVGLEFGRF